MFYNQKKQLFYDNTFITNFYLKNTKNIIERPNHNTYNYLLHTKQNKMNKEMSNKKVYNK